MRLQLIICHKKELRSSLSFTKLVLIRNKCYQCKLVCIATRGAKTRGRWGIYPHNFPHNLTVFTLIIWVWSTYASPPILWLWSASQRKSLLEFGEKSAPVLVKTFVFSVFTWIRGKKCSIFGEDHFVWSSLNLLIWKKIMVEAHTQMLKIRQNWVEIANYPPQCSTKIGTPDLYDG